MSERPNSSDHLKKRRLAASKRLTETASALVNYGRTLNSAALALLFVFIAGTAANIASSGNNDLSMIGKSLHAIQSLLWCFGTGLLISAAGYFGKFFSDLGDTLQIKGILFKKNKITTAEHIDVFEFLTDMIIGVFSTCWAIFWICYTIHSLIFADYSKVHW